MVCVVYEVSKYFIVCKAAVTRHHGPQQNGKTSAAGGTPKRVS